AFRKRLHGRHASNRTRDERHSAQSLQRGGALSGSLEGMNYVVTKSDDEWKAELSPEEFAVLRQAATERPWTGELLDENREGVYRCKGCGAELFRSDAKFDSHCGWPSFYIPSEQDAVELRKDTTLGMQRVEVL